MGKKARHRTDAGKKLRRKNRQDRTREQEGWPLQRGTAGLTTSGDRDPWGLVRFSPTMTVTEFFRRKDAGERIDPDGVEFTDPDLERAFADRTRRWRDEGDSLWDLEDSVRLGEFLPGLFVDLESSVDGPRWCVYYPASHVFAREPDEVYTSGADLLKELDRLEEMWTIPGNR
ncbi:hypothetical protein [Rhodococcus erythropolis]|uniref:Uncharacterized protein n=1 Tax=Rhodococcus erythropolis TaxID=1833 RepID=A0A8I1D4P7_RHOER|nr:hypothetical protein [Rhodococcus erythropolis]MBH5141422.1 hypothetical protein [Rhodococcus erythropolis]